MLLDERLIKKALLPLLCIIENHQKDVHKHKYICNNYDSDNINITCILDDSREYHLRIKESSSVYHDIEFIIEIDKSYYENNEIHYREPVRPTYTRITMANSNENDMLNFVADDITVKDIPITEFGEELYFQYSTVHKLKEYEKMKNLFDIYSLLKEKINYNFHVQIKYLKQKEIAFNEEMMLKKLWAFIPLMND